jgi:hypothetical protein
LIFCNFLKYFVDCFHFQTILLPSPPKTAGTGKKNAAVRTENAGEFFRKSTKKNDRTRGCTPG